jgi:hypothetical protein
LVPALDTWLSSQLPSDSQALMSRGNRETYDLSGRRIPRAVPHGVSNARTLTPGPRLRQIWVSCSLVAHSQQICDLSAQ